MLKRLVLLLVCTLLGWLRDGHAVEYTPTYLYSKQFIAGFTVLIHPEVFKHKTDAEQVLIELTSQLEKITRVTPPAQLARLKQTRIWVEWLAREQGAAEFHPSREWLLNNGYNPEKEADIEISHSRNFVNWSRAEQPWMLMHELAHAFQHRVLGDSYEPIETAYRLAAAAGVYAAVPYINGGKLRAYALNNSREYFAELTEAWFGKNDFFPYNRQELAEFDAVGFRLMASVWGQ